MKYDAMTRMIAAILACKPEHVPKYTTMQLGTQSINGKVVKRFRLGSRNGWGPWRDLRPELGKLYDEVYAQGVREASTPKLGGIL